MAVLGAPLLSCHVGADLLAPATSTTPSTSRFCSPSQTAPGRVRSMASRLKAPSSTAGGKQHELNSGRQCNLQGTVGGGSGADTWRSVRGSLPADAAGGQRHTSRVGGGEWPRVAKYSSEGEGERDVGNKQKAPWQALGGLPWHIWGLDPPRVSVRRGDILCPSRQSDSSIWQVSGTPAGDSSPLGADKYEREGIPVPGTAAIDSFHRHVFQVF